MAGERVEEMDGAVEGALKEESKLNPEEQAKEPTKEQPEKKPESEEAKGTPGKEEIIEDPEIDLGLDAEKKPLKFKRSQILEMHKGSMLQADYTKKTQEIAAEKAQLKEVVEIVDYLKKNPGKAERIVKILEEKEEQLEKQEGKLEAKEDEIDLLLKDLPEDDPYAKALRAQKAMVQKALDLNKSLQDKLSQFEARTNAVDESKIQSEAQQTLQEVLGETQKSLTFTDPEEAEYWKKSVLTLLINNPKEYSEMSKEQFVEYFKKLGQNVYSDIKKIGEKHVASYIKSKGPGAVPVAPGGAGSDTPKKVGMDNLQETLEEEFKKQDTT
jgi:hypothetical protein